MFTIFASKHNKVNRWNIDTKGFEYRKNMAEEVSNICYSANWVDL